MLGDTINPDRMRLGGAGLDGGGVQEEEDAAKLWHVPRLTPFATLSCWRHRRT
jgi:hypothetical protein